MSPSTAAKANGRSETIEFLLGSAGRNARTDAPASLPGVRGWKPKRHLNAHTHQFLRHRGRQGLRAGRSARPAAATRVHGCRLLRPAGVPCELRGGRHGPHDVSAGARGAAMAVEAAVFVLTSSALPDDTPSDVTSAPTAKQ